MLKWIPNPTRYLITNFVSGSIIYCPEYCMWLPCVCVCALWVVVNVSMAGKRNVVWNNISFTFLRFLTKMASQEHIVKCVTTCHWLILVELETCYIIYKWNTQQGWTAINERGKLLSLRLNSSERSIEITKPISLFVALDLCLLSVVDGIGFKKLLNYIEPGYPVPSRPHC